MNDQHTDGPAAGPGRRKRPRAQPIIPENKTTPETGGKLQPLG
jgi:hypothetical protein